MALRGKSPEAVNKRLKMMVFGPAGCGKTTAALQFSKPYVIDTERGSENYAELVHSSGGAVFQTVDMLEVIAEVKSLMTEKHEYRTLVIDPITTVYADLLEKCERKVGTEFGRHFGEANKVMKRFYNLIMALDMNVVVTAHAKKELGPNMAVLGQTFDGPKSVDYVFDLVIDLSKKGKKRYGHVVKSRLKSFPEDDTFEWSFAAIKERYGAESIEKQAAAAPMATQEQLQELDALLDSVNVPDDWIEKCWKKAGVECWEDMRSDTLAACLTYLRQKKETPAAA